MYRFIKAGGHLPLIMAGVPSCVACVPTGAWLTWNSMIVQQANTMRSRVAAAVGSATPAPQWANKLHPILSRCNWEIAPAVTHPHWHLLPLEITKFAIGLWPALAWDGEPHSPLPRWAFTLEANMPGKETFTWFAGMKEQVGGSPAGIYVPTFEHAVFPSAGITQLQITMVGSTSV
jgi:hypothetical protein